MSEIKATENFYDYSILCILLGYRVYLSGENICHLHVASDENSWWVRCGTHNKHCWALESFPDEKHLVSLK